MTTGRFGPTPGADSRIERARAGPRTRLQGRATARRAQRVDDIGRLGDGDQIGVGRHPGIGDR